MTAVIVHLLVTRRASRGREVEQGPEWFDRPEVSWILAGIGHRDGFETDRDLQTGEETTNIAVSGNWAFRRPSDKGYWVGVSGECP
jgi:hypothetical protein